MSRVTGCVRRSGLQRGFAAAALAVVTTVAMVALWGVGTSAAAPAGEPPVALGTASSFAVLAAKGISNTGPSVVSGDLGISPGSVVTGFPPGQIVNGSQHIADAVAVQAQSDLTTAYNDAAGRTPDAVVSTDLGGQTLTPGVYSSPRSPLALTGTVTLDGQGDLNAVFILQAGSDLITAPNSTVRLVGGVQPCNVFWQVGGSASVGPKNVFVGSILALNSVGVQRGTTISGRVLARNGEVRLETDSITQPTCKKPPPSTTTVTATATVTATTTEIATTTAPATTISATITCPTASASPTNTSSVPVPTVIAGGLGNGPPSPGSGSSPPALVKWLAGGLTGVVLVSAVAGALLRRRLRHAA